MSTPPTLPWQSPPSSSQRWQNVAPSSTPSWSCASSPVTMPVAPFVFYTPQYTAADLTLEAMAVCSHCNEVMPPRLWNLCERRGHAVCTACIERSQHRCRLCGKYGEYERNHGHGILAFGLDEKIACPHGCETIAPLSELIPGGAHWLACEERLVWDQIFSATS